MTVGSKDGTVLGIVDGIELGVAVVVYMVGDFVGKQVPPKLSCKSKHENSYKQM